MNEEHAHAAAHRDRDEHATRTLDIAVRDGARILSAGLRRGDPHAFADAAVRIAKGQRSASRVLGGARG